MNQPVPKTSTRAKEFLRLLGDLHRFLDPHARGRSLVPTLRVGMQTWPLRGRVRLRRRVADAERRGLHSHAERGNEEGSLRSFASGVLDRGRRPVDIAEKSPINGPTGYPVRRTRS